MENENISYQQNRIKRVAAHQDSNCCVEFFDHASTRFRVRLKGELIGSVKDGCEFDVSEIAEMTNEVLTRYLETVLAIGKSIR